MHKLLTRVVLVVAALLMLWACSSGGQDTALMGAPGAGTGGQDPSTGGTMEGSGGGDQGMGGLGEGLGGAEVGSGVYLYRMVAGDFVQVNKMILMK